AWRFANEPALVGAPCRLPCLTFDRVNARRHARHLRTLECAVIDPARPYSREINRETDDVETHARALCWHGKGDVRVDTVPDPGIIKITACATCGSDLHLLRA